jgi:inorganic pyrophosphatase
MRIDRISPFVPDRQLCRIVIETPRHSRHKYAYDQALDAIRLTHSLPEGLVFPFDFGFVPGTHGDDGDTVDVLVLADSPLFAGCIVECRIVGLLEAQQKQETGEWLRNDRFIAVAAVSFEYREVRDTGDLPRQVLDQTEQFFVNYNRLRGRSFRPLRVLRAQAAWERLQALAAESQPVGAAHDQGSR